MKLFVAIGLSTFALACSGSDPMDDGPQFEEPQILPDQSPICVSYRDVTVGDTIDHNILLTNEGKMPLIIMGGSITDDADGNFMFDDVRVSASEPCSAAQPCSLEFDEQAAARIFFTPKTEGWHTANLLINSNAQNFPMLRTFILARARPMGLGPNDPYDAGPKPAAANPGTTMESCRDEDRP